MFDRLGRELRLACRGLQQSPGYTATAVTLLTLGLGVNTTIFTLVRQLYFAPPAAVAQPQDLVRLDRFSQHGPGNGWSYPDFEFFRRQVGTFSGLASFASGGEELTAHLGERPEPLRALFCSGNYFDVLGVVPAAGRFFLAEEDTTPPSQPAVVISYRLWQRAFGGRQQAVGTTLKLGEQSLTVVGVAPAGFVGVSPAEAIPDLWIPIAVKPAFDPMFAQALIRSTDFVMVWLEVLGRLAPGVTREAANSDLARVSSGLGEELPEWKRNGDGVNLLPDFRYGVSEASNITNLVRLMAVAIGLVLGIVILNLSLLQLARATSRTGHAGVRLALGARRRDLLRLELVEGLILALAGGIGAFAAAFWSADWLGRALPMELSVRFRPNLTILALSLATALLVALASGLAAALFVSHTDVMRVIKLTSRVGGWARLRQGLGVAQIALAVALLAAAMAFVASFRKANAVPLGFATGERVVVRLGLTEQGFDPERAERLLASALRELPSVPGVERVSSVQVLPFYGMWVSSIRAAEGTAKGISVRFNHVGPDFFAALDIPLLSGRSFAPEEHAGSADVAVVSRSTAERVWPGQDPIGQELLQGFGDNAQRLTVVGVVPDLRFDSLDVEMKPRLFLPAGREDALDQNLLLVSRRPAASLLREVEAVLLRVEPRLGIPRLEPLSAFSDRVLRPYRLGAALMGFFAVLAVLLTAAGLYGVLAFEVTERRREIGVSLALGASRQAVARQVLRRGFLLCAFGIPLGALGAIWGGRFLATFLFRNQSGDPLDLIWVALLAIIVVAAASALPAWRASKVNPVEMLREG